MMRASLKQKGQKPALVKLSTHLKVQLKTFEKAYNKRKGGPLASNRSTARGVEQGEAAFTARITISSDRLSQYPPHQEKFLDYQKAMRNSSKEYLKNNQNGPSLDLINQLKRKQKSKLIDSRNLLAKEVPVHNSLSTPKKS